MPETHRLVVQIQPMRHGISGFAHWTLRGWRIQPSDSYLAIFFGLRNTIMASSKIHKAKPSITAPKTNNNHFASLSPIPDQSNTTCWVIAQIVMNSKKIIGMIVGNALRP